MNIQIFGTKKCNDTKKAERFFKERGIKFQFIDMKEKGMSKGELTAVANANGGIDAMINPVAKDKDAEMKRLLDAHTQMNKDLDYYFQPFNFVKTKERDCYRTHCALLACF